MFQCKKLLALIVLGTTLINAHEQIFVKNGEKFSVLISEEQIRARVKEIGGQINKIYQDKLPIFIGVLNGSAIFLADLVREVDLDCEIDFLKISSYGNQKTSSGEIKVSKGLSRSIEGEDVIIVEDIIDSGRSITFLKDYILKQNPHSLCIVSLLYKTDSVKLDFSIDYVGFEIGSDFIVGYGLDYAQKYRNLKSLYKITACSDEVTC